MLSKKTKNRSLIFFLSSILLIISVFLSLKVLEDNVLYFLSPTEIKEKQNLNLNKQIRIGGMVKKDSINEENKKYNFIITDFNKEISVTYSGILPNLFVEGQGAVVEGNLISRKTKYNFNIIKNKLLSEGVKKVDYIELIDLNTLQKPKKNKYNLFFAFYIDKVRFIDNF